jgi:hypothetical protein
MPPWLWLWLILLLLLLWPLLARPWRRLWSARPGPSTRPGPDERQPWRPYLAAAVVPVALLALSLTPLPASYARHDATPASCSRLLAWRSGPGFGDKVRHPPPGTARRGYVTALTGFRTAGLDLRDNKVDAAMTITQSAITADQEASTILNDQVARCRR